MVRIGTSGRGVIPGQTRELDRPEYAHLGPGYYSCRDSALRLDKGIEFQTSDRFSYTPGMCESETARLHHLGPGCYSPEPEPPSHNLASQPTFEFGGRSSRFEALNEEQDLVLAAPESVHKGYWSKGPVMRGTQRKSDARPFMNHSYQATQLPAPSPPQPPTPRSPFAARLRVPPSPRGAHEAAAPGRVLLRRRAATPRAQTSTRTSRATGVPFASLELQLQSRRAHRAHQPSPRKWTPRPSSAQSAEPRAPFRVVSALSRPHTARVTRELKTSLGIRP